MSDWINIVGLCITVPMFLLIGVGIISDIVRSWKEK